MTKRDAFDRRLADALRNYALEAPTEIDPLDLARSIARGYPRTPGWSRVVRGRPLLVWAVLGAILLLASMLALAVVGAVWKHADPVTVDQRLLVSDELYGDWQSEIPAAGSTVPAGRYRMNLGAVSLIRGPDDLPLEWVGRVTRFSSIGPGAWELDVMSQASCGDGRYVVRRYGDGLRFTDPIDACRDRAAILVGALVWSRAEARVPLTAGESYGSWTFPEPFHFVMPAIFQAIMEPDDQHGVLHVQHGCCWVMTFLDDVQVRLDDCDPTRTLPDVPATPEAVGEWLRSSPGMIVGDPVAITVDGRTALRFDVRRTTTSCHQPATPVLVPNVMLGDGDSSSSQVFAIPTDDDVILLVAWADRGSRSEVERAADEIVGSMTFDH